MDSFAFRHVRANRDILIIKKEAPDKADKDKDKDAPVAKAGLPVMTDANPIGGVHVHKIADQLVGHTVKAVADGSIAWTAVPQSGAIRGKFKTHDEAMQYLADQHGEGIKTAAIQEAMAPKGKSGKVEKAWKEFDDERPESRDFKAGHVYHQDHSDGRSHFKAEAKQKNGRWSGKVMSSNRKPVNGSADPSLPFWKKTPEAEVPAKLMKADSLVEQAARIQKDWTQFNAERDKATAGGSQYNAAKQTPGAAGSYSKDNMDKYIAGLHGVQDKYHVANGFTSSAHDSGKGFSYSEGQKYNKVFVGQPGHRSVHSFVNRDTGDIHYPKGAAGPTKQVRGNIGSASNGMEAIGPSAHVRYLKADEELLEEALPIQKGGPGSGPPAGTTAHADSIPRSPRAEKSHQKNLASDNWHTRTMAQNKDKSNDALRFTQKDASEAGRLAHGMGNAQSEGKYADEVHYASMELKARSDHALKKGDDELVQKDWAKWKADHPTLSPESYHYSMKGDHEETANKAYDKGKKDKGDQHMAASIAHHVAAQTYGDEGPTGTYNDQADRAERASQAAGALKVRKSEDLAQLIAQAEQIQTVIRKFS